MASDQQLWDEAVKWVRLMIEAPEFDSWERDYKITLGERLAELRQKLFEGEDVSNAIKSALLVRPTIPSWRAVDTFTKAWQASPEPAATALKTLWNSDISLEDRISGFVATFPTDEFINTNLISALHMAMDTTQFPPYKPDSYNYAAKTLGYVFPRRNVRTDQHLIYQDALDFLDRIIEESESRGVHLRDRLDAQGIVWTFGTKSTGFDSWDDETKSAFGTFIGSTPDEPAEVVPTNSDNDGAEAPTMIHLERRPVSLTEIVRGLQNTGMRIDERTIRRYHLSLKSRGFVILAGVSGTGKTWLAEAYAHITGANFTRIAVAPN